MMKHRSPTLRVWPASSAVSATQRGKDVYIWASNRSAMLFGRVKAAHGSNICELRTSTQKKNEPSPNWPNKTATTQESDFISTWGLR